MTPASASHLDTLRRWLASPVGQLLLVFTVTLLVTGALAAGVAESIRRQDRLAFQHEVDRSLEAIVERITITGNLVRGAAGLFSGSDRVSAQEFQRYVRTLQLAERYPGILGLGFTHWVEPGEVERFEAEMRAQGRPGFRLWPYGSRSEYTAITFLEPRNVRNAAAIGYDMWSEPTRRAAMREALERRDLVASGRVTLVQEIDRNRQAGFLLYLPVFKADATGREYLLGFAYSPLRADDLLAGTSGRGRRLVDYVAYDGTDADPSKLMRRTTPDIEPAHARFTADRVIDVAGRPWLVRFHSRPELEALSRRWLVGWLALAAFLTSALLARLAWSQGRARRLAETAATAQRDAARVLHREREWLRATLTSIGDGVVAVDAGARVTWMNPVAETLTGWPREVATGHGIADVVQLMPDRGSDPATSTAVGKDGLGREMLRARDGTLRPVYHSRAPILETGGSISGAVIVVHDASEQHRVEAELRESDRRKDEFLAMLAHELRNPLAPIGAAAALLQMPETDSRRVEHASAVILRQVAHMTELVDDLIDVSRVSRGVVTLDVETFDLREAAAAAIEQVHSLVERHRHHLETRLDERPLTVRGDRTRLTQVLANLLNNAAKYTPPGGHIRIRTWRDDGQVHVAVSDTGIGIGAELLPRVFELFTQGDRSLDRSQGGLGIGLALVRSVVEMHGGQVRAHSDGPGTGSLFEVTLPAAEPASAVSAAEPVPEPSAARSLRIAIVDDNEDAARTLALLLEAYGHEARTFGDAEELLAAPDPRADAFILDIGLPGLSGLELAQRLRADPRTASAPLFALSGYGQASDIAASRQAGFVQHFVKPVNPERLLDALSTLRNPAQRP